MGKYNKMLVVTLSSLMVFSNLGQVFADTVKDNISTESKEDIDFRAKKHKEFEEIFKIEMDELRDIQARNKMNLLLKSESKLISEAKDSEPIIESEKTIDGEFYKLTVYPNGVYTQEGIYGGVVEEVLEEDDSISRAVTGITGGSTTSGSGYVNGTNRIAYSNLYATATQNTLQGHTIQVTFSYSLVNGGYDKITKYALGPNLLGAQDAYKYGAKLSENSSGSAYVKYRYKGRTYSGASSSIFNDFEFGIYVGNDKITLKSSLL